MAIAAVYGKPMKCELCKGANQSKRFEWSNKDHKYSLNIKHWWQLCAVCHRRYDRKKFDWQPWNKGKKKIRPTLICEWCGGSFSRMRTEQIYCSRRCASYRNGNIQKRRRGYLLENNLLSL